VIKAVQNEQGGFTEGGQEASKKLPKHQVFKNWVKVSKNWSK
jgi:hypothetical protein